MKNIVRILVALATVILVANCGHKRVKFAPGQMSTFNEKDEKGLNISVDWVKSKKGTIDLLATLKNTYDHPVTFKRSGISLKAGAETGALTKFEFSGDMSPGFAEKGVIIFAFAQGVPKAGTAILKIDGIKSEDGKKTYPPLTVELPLAN